MMKRLFIFLALPFSFSAFADNPTQLHKINLQIAQLQTLIVKEKSARQEYQHELQNVETKSSKLSLQIGQTQQSIATKLAQVAAFNQKVNAEKAQLTNEQQQLAVLLQQAYRIGQQPVLKILLDQSSLERSQRLLVYYRYLSEAQSSVINQIQQTLNQLKQNQTNLLNTTNDLEQTQAMQKQQQRQLDATKQQRVSVINQLNQSLTTRQAKLDTLTANKKLLQNTLQKLSQTIQYQGRFGTLLGKLIWPVQGHLLNLYGQTIDQSEIKWEGVLIQAPEDTPVRAIADGNVIFAKWMPGYGLLMIISHGNGYMTLYGRNHNLYKQVGDTVHAGDLIADVGNSGGYDKSALYFAIRHNALPLDPSKWCR